MADAEKLGKIKANVEFQKELCGDITSSLMQHLLLLMRAHGDVCSALAAAQEDREQAQGRLAAAHKGLHDEQERRAERERELQKMRGEGAERERELKKFRGEVAERERELQKMRGEVAERERELQKMRGEVLSLTEIRGKLEEELKLEAAVREGVT